MPAQLAAALDLEPGEILRPCRGRGRDAGRHVDRDGRIPVGDLAVLDRQRIDLRCGAVVLGRLVLAGAETFRPGRAALRIALEEELRPIEVDPGEVDGAVAKVGQQVEAHLQPGQREEVGRRGPARRLDADVLGLELDDLAEIEGDRPLDPHRHADPVAGDTLDRALQDPGIEGDPRQGADDQDRQAENHSRGDHCHASEHRCLPIPGRSRATVTCRSWFPPREKAQRGGG